MARPANFIKVVKCETNDLLVPATCEIVFEGTISLTETAPEGPFGDQPGYIFPGEQVTSPLFKVNTITYRDNPILPLCVPGRATDETVSALPTDVVLSYN